LDVGPMSRMWPFSITMVTSFCGPAPVPSMTVACVRAVTCAETRTAKNRAVARIIIALDLFIRLHPSIRKSNVATYIRFASSFPNYRARKHITAPTRGSMAKLKMDHCFGMLDENLNAGAEGQRRQAC